MKEGCILTFENTCQKYGILCAGKVEQKNICPEWVEGVIIEEYNNEKIRLELIKEQAEEKDKEIEWNDKYEQAKVNLAFQVNAKTIDWKVIKNKFGFKSENQAKKYVSEKLTKDGLIGCENCYLWNVNMKKCTYSRQNTEPSFSCRNFQKS